MPLPQLLLVDDSFADVQAFIALIRRMGVANVVVPVGTVDDARRHLTGCAPAAMPVVVFAERGLTGADDFVAWIQEQDAPVAAIPVVGLQKPLDMYEVMGALKALALPERARIDTMTLTVRVELWPHGTVLERL